MPITALPTPPSRQDPANFAARGDALLSALPTFVTEANALQSDVNAKQGVVADDRLQTGQDRTATGQDRTQTGQDRTATASDRTLTLGYRDAAAVSAGLSSDSAAQALLIYGTTNAMNTALQTAAAQNALAQTAAASASSVLAQDLSAIGAALHRSPNAITAMCAIDLSKDSDGGAWADKCQHTSWYNEPLCGAWRGAVASEAACRAISGTATGDYFQLTTDGKFYKLNATAGVTEVFRGNKAKPGRLMVGVQEGSNFNIYDVTEKGCPMWMRFKDLNLSTGNGYLSAAFLGGVLTLGSNSNVANLALINFAKDDIRLGFAGYLTAPGLKYRKIADRNLNTGGYGSPTLLSNQDGYQLAGTSANAIAMTTLPDAPVDPVTGLQVPTIAVATAAGTSVIKHDGTVQLISSGSQSVAGIEFTAKNALSFAYVQYLGVFLTPYPWTATPALIYDLAGAIKSTLPANSKRAKNVLAAGSGALLVRENQRNLAAGLTADIKGTHSTGFMVGDIRRAYLANTEVESVGSGELVTNGTFDADTAGWAPYDASATLSNVGGKLRVTIAAGTATGRQTTGTPTVIGKSYVCTVDMAGSTGTAYNFYIGNSAGQGNLYQKPLSLDVGTFSAAFIATATTTFINMQVSGAVGSYGDYDNISVREAVSDRSYKAAGATVYGTLTKTPVATGAQLVAYSGFSAVNYIQEPYSADLDFPGEMTVGAPVNVPVVMPASSFPVTGVDLVVNGTFTTDTSSWLSAGTQTFSSVNGQFNISAITGGYNYAYQTITTVIGKWYRYTIDTVSITGGSGTGGSVEVGTVVGSPTLGSKGMAPAGGTTAVFFQANSTATIVWIQTHSVYATSLVLDNASVKEVAGPSILADRSAATGPSFRLGMEASGKLTATAYDGVTTRTVTTDAAYNTATNLKAAAHCVAGKLAIEVNGREVKSVTGAPLLTLANPNAVLTIGNSRTLDAPWPGSITLLKIGATVPTPEQSAWMYEQEKMMFREGAQITLPSSAAVSDLDYDESQDKWVAVQAGFESSFTGLIRTGSAAVSAGSFSKVSAKGGVKLLARTTTNPGVDIVVPAYGLREELVRRGEAAARSSRPVLAANFDAIGFTATTAVGSNQLTVVGSVVGTPYIGMGITGTGIPSGSTVIGISGATYTISANATAAGTAVAMGQCDFTLDPGMTAVEVIAARQSQREGATKDYIRLFDGFRETVRFAVSPGSAAWVQILQRKEAV